MTSNVDEERIFVEERRNRIIEILSRKNRASVAELSQEFRIGEATIRRDLQELENRGLVLRTHGGVLVMDTASRESPLKERETHNREKKERIAQCIAQFVRNGESIMIDGGTTTLVRQSLLRSPLFPDPTADQGIHVLRMAVRVTCEVLDAAQEGYRINLPLRVVDGATPVAPTVSVDNPAIAVQSVPIAEDRSG